jgi:hypothetical protein
VFGAKIDRTVGRAPLSSAGGALVGKRRFSARTLVSVKVAALVAVVVVLGAVAIVAASVAIANRGSDAAAVTTAQTERDGCAYLAGWRKLADRIKAPVYCPGWIPNPLTAQIGGPWNIIEEVDADRSYLMGFAWQETAFGGKVQEVHVNFRGQPGNTRIPSCQDVSTVAGVTHRKNIPCFQDPDGTVRSANGIVATKYTVNHGADSWHVLLAWRRGGGLYTLSEHVASPLTYSQVLANLQHMLDRLVLVRPRS